jgi:hypothetical protein
VGPSISITETCKKNELIVKEFEGNRIEIIWNDLPVRVVIQEDKEKQNGQKIVCRICLNPSLFIECIATLHQELHCFSFIISMVITFHGND